MSQGQDWNTPGAQGYQPAGRPGIPAAAGAERLSARPVPAALSSGLRSSARHAGGSQERGRRAAYLVFPAWRGFHVRGRRPPPASLSSSATSSRGYSPSSSLVSWVSSASGSGASSTPTRPLKPGTGHGASNHNCARWFHDLNGGCPSHDRPTEPSGSVGERRVGDDAAAHRVDRGAGGLCHVPVLWRGLACGTLLPWHGVADRAGPASLVAGSVRPRRRRRYRRPLSRPLRLRSRRLPRSSGCRRRRGAVPGLPSGLGVSRFLAATAIWSSRSMSCFIERTKSPGVRPGTESRTSSSFAPRTQR